MTIIDWNGTDLPAELRGLPAGKYVIQRADDALSPEEEEGLVAAMKSVQDGQAIADSEARARILRRVRR